ncbi:MAG TPA: hypothetical protein VM243_21510 [Phycisphaerae bacterium]|nr:hypothetical protein [Phycisphaerae bacterium]
MTRSSTSRRSRLLIVMAVFACGQVLALLPSCETVLTTANPCGSIFGFCDPIDVDLMFADIPDYSLDPSCSIPYYGVQNGAGGAGGAGACATTPVYPYTPGPRPD